MKLDRELQLCFGSLWPRIGTKVESELLITYREMQLLLRCENLKRFVTGQFRKKEFWNYKRSGSGRFSPNSAKFYELLSYVRAVTVEISFVTELNRNKGVAPRNLAVEVPSYNAVAQAEGEEEEDCKTDSSYTRSFTY